MFHLQERQLHIILGLLFGVSILLFCIMALPECAMDTGKHQLETMKDYSEAWVCDYETDNQDKLAEYLDAEAIAAGSNSIREVVTLPASLPVAADGTLVMTNKLPDIIDDMIYMTFETKRQSVEVYAGQDCIYKSSDRGQNMSKFHMIPILSQYRGTNVTIKLKEDVDEKEEKANTDAREKRDKKNANLLKVGKIRYGSYSQLVANAFSENGIYAVTAVILIVFSVLMMLLWFWIPNMAYKKRVLINAGLEGFGLGILFALESHLFQVLTGWNYSIHFVKAVMILLIGVLHLQLVRCFIYKKKVLSLVDMGILFYGVCYVSFMVLQGFSLMSFETIYLIGKILFGIALLIYTIVLMVAVYDYGRKEGRMVLFGNGVLLLSILAQFVSWILNKENSSDVYLPLGFLLYLMIIWFYGLKQAVYVKNPSDTGKEEEVRLRGQIVEQINPNLIFASFHTLQKMIKNGSENSVKMIYYISVYFRDNLRALDKAGEVVSFEEELEHIIAYLQLQKTRNQSLNFAVECKEKDFKIPRHSIEPMVENAVKYGIAGKEHGGNVVVRSYRREDGYAIQVIDDGIGFDKTILTRKSETALLRLLDMLKSSCKAQTEIISKEGKGTVITIVLPMLENDLLEEI
ncbi:MAG: histidine kinase [Clostridiales bacterium]|nr:histidine kinase [Clostridiales bacterium]